MMTMRQETKSKKQDSGSNSSLEMLQLTLQVPGLYCLDGQTPSLYPNVLDSQADHYAIYYCSEYLFDSVIFGYVC